MRSSSDSSNQPRRATAPSPDATPPRSTLTASPPLSTPQTRASSPLRVFPSPTLRASVAPRSSGAALKPKPSSNARWNSPKASSAFAHHSRRRRLQSFPFRATTSVARVYPACVGRTVVSRASVDPCSCSLVEIHSFFHSFVCVDRSESRRRRRRRRRRRHAHHRTHERIWGAVGIQRRRRRRRSHRSIAVTLTEASRFGVCRPNICNCLSIHFRTLVATS